MKGDWYLCGMDNRTCAHALLTSSLSSPTYNMDKIFHTQYPYVLEIAVVMIQGNLLSSLFSLP